MSIRWLTIFTRTTTACRQFNKSSGPVQFGVNYTFSKDLATAASYNNNIPDPVTCATITILTL